MPHYRFCLFAVLFNVLALFSNAQNPDSAAVLNFANAEEQISSFSVVPDAVTAPRPDVLQTDFRQPIQSKRLSLRSVVIPSAMITYGALTFTSNDLRKINLAIREELYLERSNGTGKQLHIDNFTLLAPAVAVYALNLAGVKGKNNFVDRTIIYGMSNLIGEGIVSSAKRMSSVMRPDSSNKLSFPSGHTAKAFIAAEFLRQEYGHLSPWYGVAGYAAAAGTGFLRMYNNKHWLNDVLAGAGVGILSTRISYWLYPKIKNALFKNSKGSTVIMPTYQDKAFGVGLVHTFN